MLERWESDRAQQLRKAEEDLIGTSLLIAEAVIHRSVSVDSTVVRGPLQSALELVRRPTDVIVRVHSEDHEFVTEILDDVVASISSCTSAQLRVDDDIERGGCRLDLDGGSIDATLATQLERIATMLMPTSGDDS